MAFFRKKTAARPAAAAPQPTGSVQGYRNIQRNTIRSDDKQGTLREIVRLAASRDARDKKFAAGVVRDLMDFKAAEHEKKQSQMQSALGSLRRRFQAPPNGAQVTYDACVMLVKNRSSVFKSKLPDTARRLVEAMLEIDLPPPGVVSDTNRNFLNACHLTRMVNRAEERHLITKFVQALFEGLTSSNDKYWNATEMRWQGLGYYRYITHADALNKISIDVNRADVATLEFFCRRPARVGGASGVDPMLMIASDWVRQQNELDIGFESLDRPLLLAGDDRRRDETLEWRDERKWGREQERLGKPNLRYDLLKSDIMNRDVALRLPLKQVEQNRRKGGLSVTVAPGTIEKFDSFGCWRSYDRRGVRPARDMERVGGLCTAMCCVGLSQMFFHTRGAGFQLLYVLNRVRGVDSTYENVKEKLLSDRWPGLDSFNFLESSRATLREMSYSCDGGNVGSSCFWYNTFVRVEGGEEGRRWRRFVKYSVPVSVSFREAGAYYSCAGATSRATLVSVSERPFEGSGTEVSNQVMMEW